MRKLFHSVDGELSRCVQTELVMFQFKQKKMRLSQSCMTSLQEHTEARGKPRRPRGKQQIDRVPGKF